MRTNRSRKRTGRSGSSFDSLLAQEGIRREVELGAIKRVEGQLEQAIRNQHETKREMNSDNLQRR